MQPIWMVTARAMRSIQVALTALGKIAVLPFSSARARGYQGTP